MRGHEALIAMRLAGAVPDMVWVDDEAWRLDWADGWHEALPQHAHLQIDRSENPARVDLRCVVGLLVHVDGDDLQRVRAIRDACIAAGAKRVIAAAYRAIGEGEFVTFQQLEVTDTAGHFVCPSEGASHG